MSAHASTAPAPTAAEALRQYADRDDVIHALVAHGLDGADVVAILGRIKFGPEPLLTPEQLAVLLEVAPATLNKWRKDGAGPAYCKVGRWVRYPITDVERYLAARTRRSTAKTPDEFGRPDREASIGT